MLWHAVRAFESLEAAHFCGMVVGIVVDGVCGDFVEEGCGYVLAELVWS